jgi:hypothetical protein
MLELFETLWLLYAPLESTQKKPFILPTEYMYVFMIFKKAGIAQTV